MTEWVNFKEVRERVSLETVLLDFYGIKDLTRLGTTLVGPCPVHGGDSPRAFHAELDKNIWHCFSRCKAGGNQLDLVAQREGVSVREAALILKHQYMDEPGTSPSRPAAPRRLTPTGQSPAVTSPPREPANDDEEPEPDGNAPLDLKLNLKAWHPHLTDDRKLAQATIEHFGIGYCSMGIMRGMIAIPIHDTEGELVAYAGRRLKPSDMEKYGKYKFPKGFRKDRELYNYHRARTTMAQEGLILVEGFFSVMKLFEAGFENVVATMGCELSDAQAELLSIAPDVIVLFDGDEAGRGGARSVVSALDGRTCVRVCDLPDGLEPEGLTERGLRWLIRGMRALDIERVALTLHRQPPG